MAGSKAEQFPSAALAKSHPDSLSGNGLEWAISPSGVWEGDQASGSPAAGTWGPRSRAHHSHQALVP